MMPTDIIVAGIRSGNALSSLMDLVVTTHFTEGLFTNSCAVALDLFRQSKEFSHDLQQIRPKAIL